MTEIDGVGPDAPTIIHPETGAKESDSPYRFDLIDGPALFAIARVLKEGAEKYGEDNWRDLTIDTNLNHALQHIYAYLAGDNQDDHLSHVACRAIFALAISLDER